MSVVDAIAELKDNRIETFSESSATAIGPRAQQVPPGADVVDLVAARPYGSKVWSDGRGVDGIAVGQLGPGPGAGYATLAVRA